MTRTLSRGQRSRIVTVDIETGEATVLHESTEVLYEAPNWSLDGSALFVNGEGHLFRLGLDAGTPQRIELGDLPDLNNDHVLDPDGVHIFVSANDGHIYRAPLDGGEAVRVTNDREQRRFHFLHGVSPDGRMLAYIGLDVYADGTWGSANIFTIPAAGGEDVQLTDDDFPDDGAEYSPDGEWLYFNSERADTGAGHAQLYRMRPNGSEVRQLTFDDRVNWFPHPSPDGSALAYVSFAPGTEGHPADRDVIVRICDADGANVRDVRRLFGGQGTMNVPSWSPDGTRIALVEYPIDEEGGA